MVLPTSPSLTLKHSAKFCKGSRAFGRIEEGRAKAPEDAGVENQREERW